ncbi:sugar ABC transporter permease [Ahrensia kielensis]|uniref:Sugar ABC transporter permease n=1 Tax=Ahrensia kielensis TaxID=76980 RepID=A0ABU9T1F8_9HYPH
MRNSLKKASVPYLFLLPAVLITVAVIFVPAGKTVILSFYDYILFNPSESPYVGLGNFKRIFSDEIFWISLWNSLIWIVSVITFQFLLGLGIALLINESFWWRPVARMLVVVPWALPSVIIGLMFTWLYDSNVGVLNALLIKGGLIEQPVAWLAGGNTALPAVVVALIWQGFPFFAVTLLAALQTVQEDLYEAAELDGANAFQRFWNITLPSIAPIIATTLLLRTIWVANSLDVILVMTGGGPGYTTYTLPLYAFLKAYSSMEFGYGAALSIVLTLMLMSVVVLYVRRASREI